MANVSLIDYTGRGSADPLYAARLLAFTKNTRLNMNPDGLEDFIFHRKDGFILEEINYMSKTIQSSLEFCDLTFLIENVSRACAQQITRTRNASYQMASQRVVDMSNASYHVPESIKNLPAYIEKVEAAVHAYALSVENGETLEDARGLLPMNIHCNLMAKYNLRSLVELLRSRDSLRVQSEYRHIAMEMKKATLKAWPWAKIFFAPKEKLAREILEEIATNLKVRGDDALATGIAKAMDIINK